MGCTDENFPNDIWGMPGYQVATQKNHAMTIEATGLTKIASTRREA